MKIPKWVAQGIVRQERECRATAIGRPMRNILDMLAQGEVYEIDGVAMMRMPEIDTGFAKRAEWVQIAPALRGWIDCWSRIAPDIRLYHMGVLADRLDEDKPLTPRLVEQAREEFDRTIERLAVIDPQAVVSAIRTTEIAWELEKLEVAK
jgi:hypothetical protein